MFITQRISDKEDAPCFRIRTQVSWSGSRGFFYRQEQDSTAIFIFLRAARKLDKNPGGGHQAWMKVLVTDFKGQGLLNELSYTLLLKAVLLNLLWILVKKLMYVQLLRKGIYSTCARNFHTDFHQVLQEMLFEKNSSGKWTRWTFKL